MAAATAEEESALPRRSFPDEIEAEILLCLPVKTLIRFKCACKTWYSLISSPQFQKHHFRRAQTKPPLLLTLHRERDYGDDFRVHFCSYDDNKEGPLTRYNSFSITLPQTIYQPLSLACLGLVCLFQRYQTRPMLICNPSTQEFISLPPTQECSCCVGFGYATSTQEFKVVGVFNRLQEFQCKVFTLGTNRWRKLKNPPCNVDKGIAPFLHEAIHFLPQISFNGVEDTDCISVFDVDTEIFRSTILLPEFYYSLGDCKSHGISITKEFLRLSTLGGSLCLTFDFGECRCRLELWLLKDYNNTEWVRQYSIDVSPLYPYRSFGFWTYPTDNMVDERILLNCYFGQGVKLLDYDPHDEMVTLKKDKEWAATFYTETFYSLKRI